jgi:UDP-glucose 4-epimerase
VINSLDNLNGKTVAVTGASGYIGSALVDALVKCSCKVIRISRRDLVPQSDTHTIKADIRSATTWVEIVAKADVIYHLAGNTSVYEAAKNPAESLNSTLLPIVHLMKAAQERKCKPRVVFASTVTVYGLTPELPASETVKPEPITVYDLHKLFAEQQLALATKQGVLDSVTLRLANVYGPSTSASSADDRGILNRVIAAAVQGNDLMVYGGGNYLRDYVYITDVVSAFLMCGANPHFGGQSFNVASGVGTTVKQAFELVGILAGNATGHAVGVKFVDWPKGVASIEFRKFVADIKKYVDATGWRPIVSLEHGIYEMISDYIERERKKNEV